MRLVCDNYVIQTTSMEHVQTRITSTASATTSYHVQFLPAQTAISAKSAQTNPKKLDTKFAIFAVCALILQTKNTS